MNIIDKKKKSKEKIHGKIIMKLKLDIKTQNIETIIIIILIIIII